MKRDKYIKILILLLFIIIPNSVLGYDCVLTGSGTKCTKYKLESLNIPCSSTPSYISCSHVSKRETETIKGACRNVLEPVPHIECDDDSIVTKYNNSYTFTLNGNNQCQTISVNGYSIRTWNRWTSVSGTFGPFLGKQSSRSGVSPDTCTAYEGESTILSGGKTYYIYTTKWSRCCSNNQEKNPPTIDIYKCYRADLGNNNYDYKWTINPPSVNYKEASGIKSKDECELSNPNYCTKSNISNSKNYNFKCVNNLNTDELQTVSCENNSTDFYEISCKETFQASYLPKLNGESLSIKAGLGFDYRISLQSNKECTGVFNTNDWNNAYDKAQNLLDRAKKANDSNEISYYQNKLDEIVSAIKSFNNWNSNSSNRNIEGKIIIDYSEEKKSISEHVENFIITKKSSNNKKENLSGCINLKNGSRVCPFKTIINEEYELTPPKYYINKLTGEIVKVSYDNNGEIITDLHDMIDGGNKFYISLDAKSGNNYTISTQISGLGISSSVTINNSDCHFNIKENDKELYRIIDESNPFVNDKREIGKNWSNELFDFTKVIPKSGNALYIFNLSKQDILDIKKSNYNDPNAYLGTCSRSIDLQDNVMRPICAEINKYG